MKSIQKIFLTGASGYIGGSVAKRLVQESYQIRALIRDKGKADLIKKQGLEPVIGNLEEDLDLLKKEAQLADIVIHTADADDPYVVAAFLEALEGSGKLFLHTSGSSLVGDKANGEKSEIIYKEEKLFDPQLEKMGRIAINQKILNASQKGVHSIVLVPSMIYGQGLGIKKTSIQIPLLIELAKEKKAATYIGKGQNIWSNVHIEDLARLYLLALKKAKPGSYYFVENGEASLKDIAKAIGRSLGFEEKTISITPSDAIKRFKREGALFGLGSNSRVDAQKAKQELGWKPKYNSIFDFI